MIKEKVIIGENTHYPLNGLFYWGFNVSYKILQRVRRMIVQRRIAKEQSAK